MMMYLLEPLGLQSSCFMCDGVVDDAIIDAYGSPGLVCTAQDILHLWDRDRGVGHSAGALLLIISDACYSGAWAPWYSMTLMETSLAKYGKL